MSHTLLWCMHACTTFLRNWHNSQVKKKEYDLGFFLEVNMQKFDPKYYNYLISSFPWVLKQSSLCDYIQAEFQPSLEILLYSIEWRLFWPRNLPAANIHISEISCLTVPLLPPKKKKKKKSFNYAYVPKILIHRTFIAT